MKNRLFVIILGGLLFASCQKEMKISRSDYSVTIEINDFSPVYIDKDENGEVVVNQGGRIGNTHWILTVNRELSLEEIAPALQELTYRKFQKESNHEDTKDIYFVYSDTLNKQNAFVKLPFKGVFVEAPPMIEPTEEYFRLVDLHQVNGLQDFKHKLSTRIEIWESINEGTYEGILIDFSEKITVEEFVNILIEFDKLNISDKVNEYTHIY